MKRSGGGERKTTLIGMVLFVLVVYAIWAISVRFGGGDLTIESCRAILAYQLECGPLDWPGKIKGEDAVKVQDVLGECAIGA